MVQNSLTRVVTCCISRYGQEKDVKVLAFENIIVTVQGDYAKITLNRPEKLNPLDWETVKELRLAVENLERNGDLRVIVFTGAGPSFSAGGDLEKYLALFASPDDFRGLMEEYYRLFEFMAQSDKVFIAAINGVCVAGGLELLLACDLVVADEMARIGDGHLNFAQLPGAGSSVRLWRAVGAVRAKHIMLTGDLMSASEARSIGLVGEVAPAGELWKVVDRLVGKITNKSASTVGGAKRLLNEANRSDLDRALRHEIEFVHRYATTNPDAMEGLRAFKEKRTPSYVGSEARQRAVGEK
jgi:enoyl-CoA hydratase/carnithine racemase